MQTEKLNPAIQRALHDLHYLPLKPVQQKALPFILEGKNLFIQAKTGAGKTAAYLIPLIHQIDPESIDTQVLVITPTRELAMQVSEEASRLASYTRIHHVTVIGGVSVKAQENSLKHTPHMIIGTPGRVHDLLRQNKIDLSHLNCLVVDEADQVFSTGQAYELDSILSYVHDYQMICLSATWMDIIQTWMKKDYETLMLDQPDEINDSIQEYHLVTENKRSALLDILKHSPVVNAIVFVKYKSTAGKLSRYLNRHHILAADFSGMLDQKERIRTLDAFRNGEIRVLIATDAAARGLDIHHLSHIIHYDLPLDETTYIHRSGRTAHQEGEQGITISLIFPDEDHPLKDVILSRCPVYEIDMNAQNVLNQPMEKEKTYSLMTSTIRINRGKNDKIRPKDVIGALCTIFDFKDIGVVDIQERYTTVTILKYDYELPDALFHIMIKGKKCRIEII